LPKVDPGPAGSPQQLSVGAGVQEGEGAPVMHRGAHGAEPRFAHGPWASWGLDCCTCRHTTDRLSGIAEHMGYETTLNSTMHEGRAAGHLGRVSSRPAHSP
jgi:hypothetical protein